MFPQKYTKIQGGWAPHATGIHNVLVLPAIFGFIVFGAFRRSPVHSLGTPVRPFAQQMPFFSSTDVCSRLDLDGHDHVKTLATVAFIVRAVSGDLELPNASCSLVIPSQFGVARALRLFFRSYGPHTSRTDVASSFALCQDPLDKIRHARGYASDACSHESISGFLIFFRHRFSSLECLRECGRCICMAFIYVVLEKVTQYFVTMYSVIRVCFQEYRFFRVFFFRFSPFLCCRRLQNLCGITNRASLLLSSPPFFFSRFFVFRKGTSSEPL